MRTIGAVIASAALLLASGAGAAETWRIQTALPTAHPVHKASERWAEDVGRMTAGRLRVEILPGGAVVPDDIKAILEMSVRDLAVRINLEDTIAERAAVAADRAAGVEPIVWSPEHLAEMRRLAAEVWAEYAQASPMARKAFEAHKAFLTKLGLLQ